MRQTTATRLTASATLALFFLACATTHLPPISAAGRSFAPLPDEIALWESSRSEEEQLLAKVNLYDDPLLEEYIQGVVDELNPPGMVANPEIRYLVHVVEDPTLNAFAYPHGSLYLHTGLLARLENEAQLATVLGHEMTHVENRHMLRHQRAAQNREIGFAIAGVAASVLLAYEAGEAYYHGDWGEAVALEVLADVVVGLGLQLAFIASVNGYGRELEEEADAAGLVKLRVAGYDIAQAPKVYEALMDDHGEPPSRMEAFFFGSHPNLQKRLTRTREAMRTTPSPGGSLGNQEEFAARMRTVARDDARLNLELGRFELAESELERAQRELPSDPQTYFLLGRLALARAAQTREPGARAAHRTEARAAFTQAVALDRDHGAAYRELGLLAYEDGEKSTACAHFEASLEAAPDQPGAEKLGEYLRELRGQDACR